MNAKEARERAKTVNSENDESNYTEIKDNIEVSADDGDFYVNFYKEIREDVKIKLKSEGFVVEEGTARANECNWIIKW